MTRVRLIVTVDIDDDLDVREVVDSLWNATADIVDITVMDQVDR